MKLRELYKQYKGYDIIVWGVPLKDKYYCTPFTRLPRDKELMECEVVEYEVEEREQKIPHFYLNGTFKKFEYIKGDVYVYVK